MRDAEANRVKFLDYRNLHQQLKAILADMGWPVTNDGQLFSFTGLLTRGGHPPKAPPKAPPSKRKARAKKRTKAKKAPSAKAKKASSNAVAEGRRAVARGDRPPMKVAIAKVMGDKVMDCSEVIAGLKEKNWLPNTVPGEKTQQYISYILSSSTDAFQRVERGRYKALPQRKARKMEGWEKDLLGALSAEKFVQGSSLAKKLGWKTDKLNQRLARLKVVGKVESRIRFRHREWKISPQATA